MKERVKVFTYAGGEGSSVFESGLEEHVNTWLAKVNGKILFATQSESQREGVAKHTTICVWYAPDESSEA